MAKIDELDQLVESVATIKMELSWNDFDAARTEMQQIQERCESCKTILAEMEHQHKQKQRTITIELGRLTKSDYIRLRSKLKRRVFGLFGLSSGIPCTITATDDEDSDIRALDGW